MRERTFRREIREWYSKTDTTELSIISHNDLFYGNVILSKRDAYCRGCGKVIPKGVKKFARSLMYQYGRLGSRMVRFSYCYKCAKISMEHEIKLCNEFKAKTRKTLRKFKPKDKLLCDEKMKERELMEAI